MGIVAGYWALLLSVDRGAVDEVLQFDEDVFDKESRTDIGPEQIFMKLIVFGADADQILAS
jgi:hypothetical protein